MKCKTHKIFLFLSFIFLLITFSLAYATTIGNWQIGSNWQVGSNWLIAGASATLDHFTISVPSTATAGVSFGSITVTAYDSSNNVITDYVGSVYFTSSDSQAVLPYTVSSQYTFTSGDGGVHVFSSFTLKTAGGKTITVTDGSISQQSSSITVNANSLDHIGLTPSSASITAGNTQTYTTNSYDAYGNLIADVSASAAYNVSIGAGGSWNLNVYTSQTAGSWTVNASYSGKWAGVSLTVTIGTLDHFTMTGYPASIRKGASFGSVVVTAYDSANNVITTYTGQVYFTSTDGVATLPFTSGSKYTFVSGDNGAHSFSGFILNTEGSHTITVTDGSVSATSSSIEVNIYPITATITSPTATTYPIGNFSVQLSASTNGTSPVITFNVYNSTNWVYGSNQTYSSPITKTGFVNGTYIFVCWATNNEGWADRKQVTFTVEIITAPDVYQFTFTFKGVGGVDVSSMITWQLHNNTDGSLLTYTQGQYWLLSGTYNLLVYYRTYELNLTTWDTATYGNSTLEVGVPLDRASGIAYGGEITSLTINQFSSTIINVTVVGAGRSYALLIPVSQNATNVALDGVLQPYGSVWFYDSDNQLIEILQGEASTWVITFPPSSGMPDLSAILGNISGIGLGALLLFAIIPWIIVAGVIIKSAKSAEGEKIEPNIIMFSIVGVVVIDIVIFIAAVVIGLVSGGL